MDRRSCRIPATSRTRDRRSERRPAGNQEGPTGGRPPRPGPRPRAPPPCPRPPPGPQRSPCPAPATASAPAAAPAPSAGGVPPLLRLTVAPARRVGVEELHADATEHQARGDEQAVRHDQARDQQDQSDAQDPPGPLAPVLARQRRASVGQGAGEAGVLLLDAGREIDEALVIGLGHVSSFPTRWQADDTRSPPLRAAGRRSRDAGRKLNGRPPNPGRRRGACPPDDVVVRASERGYGEAGLPLTSRVPYGGLTHHRLRPSSSWGCTLQTARCLHVAPGENGDWYGWRTGGTALTLGRVGPRPCPAGPRSVPASVGRPTRCPAPGRPGRHREPTTRGPRWAGRGGGNGCHCSGGS